jgi:hypothetical protein
VTVVIEKQQRSSVSAVAAAGGRGSGDSCNEEGDDEDDKHFQTLLFPNQSVERTLSVDTTHQNVFSSSRSFSETPSFKSNRSTAATATGTHNVTNYFNDKLRVSTAVGSVRSEDSSQLDIEKSFDWTDSESAEECQPQLVPQVITISVADTGQGLSSERQQALLAQYVQFDSKALHNGRGLGLGLWISKSKSILAVLNELRIILSLIVHRFSLLTLSVFMYLL